MNVFVLPSWLPHRCHPLEGTFLLEQARMTAELRPEWNIGISRWGQGVARLSLSHLVHSPTCIAAAFLQRDPAQREILPNLYEFGHRAPTWTERIAAGNAQGILAANRANLRQAIARFGRIDILHAHVAYPAGWVAVRLREDTGIPVVITEHMGPFPLPVYAGRPAWVERFILDPLRRADARIAVSPALAESLARAGIPKPVLVPNVIDERLYRIVPRDPGAPFTFFTLGGMQPVKGFPDLIRAIHILLGRLPASDRDRVRFILAGYGPERRTYQRLAERLGVNDRISWPGFLPRDVAREHFQHCDCYVLASHYESFGIVLVEAMAAGKPVIATRCGGPESLVEPGNGVLVDRGAPEQLAQAMLEMFRGNREWDPERIRAGVMARFSRPAVMRELETIYADVRARAAAREAP